MVAIFINNSSCGIIIGKPRIAINADCCCAFEAMAAKKVKTTLKLIPPKVARPTNCSGCFSGLPNNIRNNNKLIRLIASISKALNKSLDRIKSFGPAIE